MNNLLGKLQTAGVGAIRVIVVYDMLAGESIEAKASLVFQLDNSR